MLNDFFPEATGPGDDMFGARKAVNFSLRGATVLLWAQLL